MDIIAIIETAGLEPRSFSGRLGVVVSNLAFDLAELVEACANVEEAAAMLRGMKTETVSGETIFYWPRVALEADAEA